jgi:hypothetical protein
MSQPSALPLVKFDQKSGNFSTDPSTLKVLASIPEPLAVVSIAGLFRTGKSFLLNRIILHTPTTGRRARKTPPPTGFGVGNTVQACTKGIWMWSEPLLVKNKDGEDVNVVVLDTEGSGAPSADASHDARISSLGLLLSSYFVYNSVGRIDDSALSALSTVTHVTSEMRAEDAGEMPGFLWVLRDFALQLTSVDGGDTVDSNTYMEEALAGEKQDARSHLRNYFKNRGCATLIRPVMEESDLQNLNTLGDASLRSEFLEAAVDLRNRILSSTANRPMQHNETMLSGGMLGALVERYVKDVNAGSVPHIGDAWECVVSVRAAEAERNLVATLVPKLEDEVTQACSTFEHSVESFTTKVQAVMKQCWDVYVTKLSPPCKSSDELRALAMGRTHSAVTRYRTALRDHVTKNATRLVDELIKEVDNDHESWSSFWKVVQTQMQAFEATHGSDETTIFILLQASQRLWDVVPEFFGNVGVARVRELETQVEEMEEELDDEKRRASHDVENFKLQLEGASRRVACVEEENEEMVSALKKAQEEVRGMTEKVFESESMSVEITTLTARVGELEETLTRVEDEAARKASEANATSLKSIEDVKELRAIDQKRHETEMETCHDKLKQLKNEKQHASEKIKNMAERVQHLNSELNDAKVKETSARRELRAEQDSSRANVNRVAELERQLVESEERARKRPRVSEADSLSLVRAQTELGFLKTQKNDLAASLSLCKERCTELERQIRQVQRTADETIQRERLLHESELAKLEMKFRS